THAEGCVRTPLTLHHRDEATPPATISGHWGSPDCPIRTSTCWRPAYAYPHRLAGRSATLHSEKPIHTHTHAPAVLGRLRPRLRRPRLPLVFSPCPNHDDIFFHC